MADSEEPHARTKYLVFRCNVATAAPQNTSNNTECNAVFFFFVEEKLDELKDDISILRFR